MVRRLKSDPAFAKKWDGTPRFPPRVLEPIEVPYTDEEREIHAALKQYTKLRAGAGRTTRRSSPPSSC